MRGSQDLCKTPKQVFFGTSKDPGGGEPRSSNSVLWVVMSGAVMGSVCAGLG